MQDYKWLLKFQTIRPPGIKKITKIPGYEKILTKKSGKLFLVKYFLDDGKQPFPKKMIAFAFQDQSFKKLHSFIIYDLRLNPAFVIKPKDTITKDELIKMVGDLISKTKFKVPKTRVKQTKNLIKEMDPRSEYIRRRLSLMSIIYGIVLSVSLIMAIRNLIIGVYKWWEEKYVEGPTEQALNKALFQGQTAGESAFGMFAGIQRYIEHIIEKRANALILCGPPGMSKTYTTRRTFYFKGLQPRKDYVIEKGSTLGLPSTYSLLYQNRNRILVLDDFDTPLMDPDTVNLLKAITDTYTKRIVSLPREKVLGHGGAGEGEVVVRAPDKFEFKGQVIIITNLRKDQIDPALLSRAPAYEVNFDTKTVLDSLTKLMKFSNPQVDIKYKKEVYEYLLKLYGNDKNIVVDFRAWSSAVDARYGNPEGWKQMVQIIVGYKGKPIREMSISEKCLNDFDLIEKYLMSQEGADYFHILNKNEVPTNLKRVEVEIDIDESDEIS
jgi:hypothetical protein